MRARPTIFAFGVFRFTPRPGAGVCSLAFALAGFLGVIGRASGGETWVKVAADRFTILTPAGESAARKWAVELEQFHRGLQSIVPVDTARLRPVTVVLFKNARAMEPYLPLEKGKPARIGGLFVRTNDLNTIVLCLARDARETRHVVFHEAVHWHLSALEGAMPLWLAEGLAELYATFELPDAKHYSFGEVIPEYFAQLRGGSILPLEQLLSIGRDSLFYNEGTRAGIFYAESWAFVHYLFYGENSPGPASVNHYLALLHAGHAPDEAFASAFGGDYATLEQRLRRYLRNGTYRKYTYLRTVAQSERDVAVAQATPAEIELAKGSLLFGARSPGEAEPHLRRAAELAPADPRAWELLGHAAVARREFDSAAELLAKAAAAGSTSYLVYHNLALTRLPDPLMAGLPIANPDPHAMDLAAGDFRHALALAPGYVPSYQGLAGLIYSMETFRPEDLDLLARGLRLAPGDAMIETGLAAGEIRAGRTAEGRARLEQIVARNSTETAGAGVQFARRILGDEALKSDMADMKRLASESKFDDAIKIADHALAGDLDPGNRQVIAGARQQIAAYQTISEAVVLANSGEATKATRILENVADSTADIAARADAERLLHQLAQRQQMQRWPMRR